MSLCYSQLTLSYRRRLHQLMERKVPVGEIARQLGRHRSTIIRELKRNTFQMASFRNTAAITAVSPTTSRRSVGDGCVTRNYAHLSLSS
jgi:IS30 family transposase